MVCLFICAQSDVIVTPILLSVSPMSGSVSGGTHVTAVGANFLADTSFCRFGAVNVTAAYDSSTRIFCISPPQDVVGAVTVAVTFNEHDYSSEYVTFTYFGMLLLDPQCC